MLWPNGSLIQRQLWNVNVSICNSVVVFHEWIRREEKNNTNRPNDERLGDHICIWMNNIYLISFGVLIRWSNVCACNTVDAESADGARFHAATACRRILVRQSRITKEKHEIAWNCLIISSDYRLRSDRNSIWYTKLLNWHFSVLG